MAAVRQTSFAAGELSPLLWGRTDLELYAHGARRISNFVVNPHGNAVSRPGTKLAWTAKEADVVLLPYIHASGDSYVFEFGHLYVRIYNALTLAMLAELATPFQRTDLPELQWAQTGSVLVVAHHRRWPQEITISGGATIQRVRAAPPGDTPGASPLSAAYPSIGGNPPADPVLVQWQPGTLFVLDAAHPPREWKYQVSTILRHIYTGEEVETLPRPILKYSFGDVTSGTVSAGPILPLPSDNQLILFPDAPIYIEPGLGDAVASPSMWVPVENLYYRGRGQIFGLVGRAAPNARFADFADEPNYAIPPLRGDSPFLAGGYPATVAFFQQRRCFAGPGSTWWASASDDWANHDAPLLPWAGQPLEATLAGRRRESIVSMVQLEHLFVFTDTSVWQIGRSDVAMDYDTLPSVVRLVDEVGSKRVMPLVVGDVILWPRAHGRGVRALLPTGQGGVATRDVSWQAEHLFGGSPRSGFGRTGGYGIRGLTVRGWTHQQNPWGASWVVRDDGTMLTVTRTGDNGWAWAQHDLGDEVVSVTSVPQHNFGDGFGGWDDIFVAVRRNGVMRVERMVPYDVRGAPRYVTDPLYSGNPIGSQQLTYPLDSHVVATITKATGTTVTGLGHLEGRDVWASCPGIEPLGPLRVAGGAVTTAVGWGPTGVTVFSAAVGLPFTCELELLDAAPARLHQKTVTKVGFEVDSAVGLEVGEDVGHLVPWRQRDVQDSYESPSAASVVVAVAVRGAWRRSGRAVLRQAKPLPVTVLGVTRELEVGGT